jgi:glutamine synthetase
MAAKDAEYVLRQAKDQDVRFIQLWFTDILGSLKSVAITRDELENAMEEGMGFDGSSIEGFARIEESDMIAKPDPSTFTLLPFGSGVTTARMFCDIENANDNSPYEGDPRYVLRRQLKRASDMGFTFYVGPELEYFYFKSQTDPTPLDEGGYFDQTVVDIAHDLRRETVETLENMGIGVEYSHHEVAHSQHEIDLRYTDALTMADSAMSYRLVVKEIALANGVYATFMPKPLGGQNGSGMHVHQSLFKDGRNAFYDENDENHLSDTAKQYIAGLMKHIPEITLVLNQWVNSYKRLVPGYEAPVYVSWAVRNRSDLIRIPGYKPGKENATRIELRSPDPSCNPYLAFAAMLAAGLEGIEKNYKVPPISQGNLYKLTPAERDKKGIQTLPGDLEIATRLAGKSALLKKALGEHVFEKLIENKRLEWDRFRAYVTDWEQKEYLGIL